MPSTRFWLGLAMILFGGIFFTSVACPPIDEMESSPDPELREGLADEGSASLSSAPLLGDAPLTRDAFSGSDDGSLGDVYDFRVVVLDADSGQPLPQAKILISYQDHAGKEFETLNLLNAVGQLHLTGLAGNSYYVRAELDGWFPSEDRKLVLPTTNEETLQFELRAGALIHGKVIAVDGTRVRRGVIKFTHHESGEEHIARVSSFDDSFSSGTIANGIWTASFLEIQHDQPDPRLSVELAMVPGLAERVEFIIQRDGMQARPGFSVSTRVVR